MPNPKSYQVLQRCFSIVTILVMVLSMFQGPVKAVQAESPTPTIVAYIVTQSRIVTSGWDQGSGVSVKVKNAEGEELYADGPQIVNPVAMFDPPFFLQAGYVIEATDGTTTVSYTVQNLNLTQVNPYTGHIAGTSDNGAQIAVNIGSETLTATTVDGKWAVDFTEPGVIQPDTMINVNYQDANNNNTYLGYYYNLPNIVAFPDGNTIGGDNWPVGMNVHLTVHDSSNGNEFGVDTTAAIGSGGNRWTNFPIQNGYDLKTGDILTATDGNTTRTTTVAALTASADPDTDTVTVTSNAYSKDIEAWVDNPHTLLSGQTDSGGNWSANFNGKVDLIPGMTGQVKVYDAQRNATQIQWRVPQPRIEASYDGWIHVHDLPLGTTATLDISGAQTYHDTNVTHPAQWDSNDIVAEFSWDRNNFQFSEGMTITISGEEFSTLSFTIPPLSVTSINKNANTLEGMAGANAHLQVWVDNSAANLSVDADGTGYWKADFSGIYAFNQGTSGQVQESDGAGNAIQMGWRVPNPRIQVGQTYGWANANDWPVNHDVQLTITDFEYRNASG